MKKGFLSVGHLPTLFASFFYFDMSFMVWVLLGPLGVQIAKDLDLSPAQKGFMVAVPVLSGALAQIIVPPDPRYTALGLQTPGTAQLEQILARFSPSTLYAEIVVALLDPTTRALGPIYLSQLQGAVLGAPLPFAESIWIAWPQMVGMIATAIVLFVIGYVIFQRQEVRA